LKRAYLQKETGTRGYAGDFSGRGDYGMPPWYENPDDPAAVAEKGLRTLEDERRIMENLTGITGLPISDLKNEVVTAIKDMTPEQLSGVGLDPADWTGLIDEVQTAEVQAERVLVRSPEGKVGTLTREELESGDYPGYVEHEGDFTNIWDTEDYSPKIVGEKVTKGLKKRIYGQVNRWLGGE